MGTTARGGGGRFGLAMADDQIATFFQNAITLSIGIAPHLRHRGSLGAPSICFILDLGVTSRDLFL